MADQMAQNENLAFEREKWRAEERRRDAEFAMRERELAFREAEARRSRLWNPLAIAILGASIAAVGNAYVSWENGKSNLEVETFRAESSRIFEMVKTGNPDKAAVNPQFLVDTGLIQSPATLANVATYLRTRKEGQGISLPSASDDPQRRLEQLQEMLQGRFDTKRGMEKNLR